MYIGLKYKHIWYFLGLLLFKILLDIAYITAINPMYEYTGFILELNYIKLIESYFWFILICFLLPKGDTRPSYVILQIHFIIMVIPMFTIYAFTNQSSIFLRVFCLCYIIEVILVRLLPKIKVVKITNAQILLYAFVGILTFFIYATMIKANGIPTLTALNLLKVYEIRDKTIYPFLLSYLVPWQAKVINPFLITIFYYNKKYKHMAAVLLMHLILYLITAHKSFLFAPIVVLGCIFIANKNKLSSLSVIGATITVGVSLFISKLNISSWPLSLFVRRLFFVPAQNKFYYYDFFSQNDLLYFADGQIGSLFSIQSPYDLNAAHLIGDVYYNNPLMAANTGYLADAYANLGFSGMLIFALIFTFILLIIDSIASNIDKGIVIGLVIMPMLTLNDGALLTSLSTHGLLLAIVTLYLYGNEKNSHILKKEDII